MKKITLFFIPIALLAAGCNSSADKVTQLEKQNQSLQAQLVVKQQADNFDMSTKCTKQAQDFFDYFENDPKQKQQDEFSNHYNTNLNKCFILLKVYNQTNINGNFSAGSSKYLYDAVERKLYGSYSWMSEQGKKYWEVPPLWCEMYKDGKESSLQTCSTEAEFGSYTESFMNN